MSDIVLDDQGEPTGLSANETAIYPDTVSGKLRSKKGTDPSKAMEGVEDHSALNLDDGTNPHNTTKTDIGLSNVPNVDATARANHTGTQPIETLTEIPDPSTLPANQHLAIKVNAAQNGYEVFQEYEAFIVNNSGEINQTTTLEEFASISAVIPVAGNYKIEWSYTWSVNDGAQDIVTRVQLDDITDLDTHQQEPKDVGGAGVVLPIRGGGTTNSGTNQRMGYCNFTVVNLTAGAHTIDLDWAGSIVDIEPTLYKASIFIKRVKE